MITNEDLLTVQRKAKTLKALVIGDAMLDIYINGIVERLSPEAPVPVLTHLNTETKAGGAANVALNLASWGCDTSIIGLTGEDEQAERLRSILNENNIATYFFAVPFRPTTQKTRVVAASHHLLRIDEESSEYLSGEVEERAQKFIEDHLDQNRPDLIILQDYNKGFLTERIISAIIEFGRNHNVFIAVDPKEKNFMSFTGANLFKPNLREASLAANKTLELEDLAGLTAGWSDKMDFSTVAITLGSQGIFLQKGDDTLHIVPSREIDVVDVCGAGDAVICGLALAQVSGLSLYKTGHLANLAGAYVCSHSGVVTIKPTELSDWI